jgi:signal transduction histidine kinase
MAPLQREMRRMWLGLLTGAGVILTVTTLASLILAHQVTEPIRRLTLVSEAMAAGRLDQHVAPAGPDEIVRLGHSFNRMAEQLHEMLARQQSFVANAAHELRSPLASLQLRLDMLQAHGADDLALQQHYLRQMTDEVGQLQRLVDHLLVLSSVDEGATLLQSPVDLAPPLYQVTDEVSPLAQAAGVQLHIDVPAHLPAVTANLDAMAMLVRNLLDNAIKYTPAGGQVTISAAVGEQPPGAAPIAPGPWTPTTGVIIQVEDTGPGIPAEHLPHIFERFYRVDKARARRQGGAGLGLALVRAIVEAHNGWVGVDSTVGKGSAFTVYLPLSPPRADH